MKGLANLSQCIGPPHPDIEGKKGNVNPTLTVVKSNNIYLWQLL